MGIERPAARITDPTSHGTPAAPGVGSTNVLVGNLPAWRTSLDAHACPTPTPTPHGPERIFLGSTTVLINNQMACRMGDILQGLGPPNPVAMGSTTVTIGDPGFSMARRAVMDAFAVAGERLLKKWDVLTPADRLKELQHILNAALPTGMPSLTIQEKRSLPPRTLGQFNFGDWAVDLNPRVLSERMDKERMAPLVNTTYHEGRHGEQWWNVAQYRASRGDSAREIRMRLGIPVEVADSAIKHPAPAGTSEGAMGEVVDNSVYGARGTYRNQVLSNLNSPEAYAQYRALPEEEDAWNQGDDAELVFRIAR